MARAVLRIEKPPSKIQPDEFRQETTTVWSFEQRGDWATHRPNYRGNFAPQIARNLILRYSKEGEVVLDPMMGGGTTLIEAKLLGRRGIGYDINPEAVALTRRNLRFGARHGRSVRVGVGDVRALSKIADDSIDLIVTHPPYLNIVRYSEGKIEGDLSNISGVNKFLGQLQKGIEEFYRVLRSGRYCAILIGDTRRSRHYVPLAFYVMERFLDTGFLLKEDIIKLQHNCSSTPYWSGQMKKYDFYMIMHEHLFVFRKAGPKEDLARYRYSMKPRSPKGLSGPM